MRLKHQSDEGSSGRQKKVRISFEHLDMDKDIYLQVELEVAATTTSKRREISQSE